jgi:hypothetical protein
MVQTQPRTEAGRPLEPRPAPSIYVGAVVGRSYEPEHVACLMRLLRHPNVQYDRQHGDALIERSRSIVATRFLERSEAEVLLHLDSDIVFRAEDALQICQQALTHNLVAGIYFTRSSRDCHSTSWLGYERLHLGDDPTPVPIRYAATGFLAAHRRVFERLAARPDLPLCHPDEVWRFYPFYLPMIVDNDRGQPVLLSEDFAFCERARQEGFSVYANPAVRLGHVGTYTYRLDDARRRPG